MACNCGCDDGPVATGWKRYVPLLVCVTVLGTLIVATALSSGEKDKTAKTKHTTNTVRP